MNGTEPDRWAETRESLTELVEWLDDARRWAEGVADHEASDDEVQQAARAFQADESAEDRTQDRPAPDLHDIVSELTALRQEVKLQTRTARHDRESASKTAEELSSALTQLEQSRADETARRDAAVAEARRGTAELLVDLHDALSRSVTEAERVLKTVIASMEALRSFDRVRTGPHPVHHVTGARGALFQLARSIFGRFRFARPARMSPTNEPRPGSSDIELLGDGAGSVVTIRPDDETAEIVMRLRGLTEGNALALRRIERALADFEIEPIQAIGLPLNPETMEVVQSVRDVVQPSGVVLAEVRRGYRRQGRIMRFAQVVVSCASK